MVRGATLENGKVGITIYGCGNAVKGQLKETL